MSQPASGVGDPTNEADLDQTGRFVRQPNGRVRPLSPHLQVWRFHVTMWASILHRITGSALVGGVVLVMAWLAALSFGPRAYGMFQVVAGSPLGLLVWFGLSLAAFYHLAAGVRHLVWDAGAGLSPRTASLLSALSLLFAAVATVALWAFLFASGRVSL